jgi:hypothetical protein
MTVRLALFMSAMALVCACGGSGSETPPPMEPTAAELSNWRPPPIPTSSAVPFEENEEEPKATEVEEEPSTPRKRKPRPNRLGD